MNIWHVCKNIWWLLPVHLHGHSFWVVGAGKEGDGDYSPSKHAHLLGRKVPKKDTWRFMAHSWLVLRYVADNPGVWFFHCHVNWHVPGGMGAVFVEGADILRKRFKEVPMESQEICRTAGIIGIGSEPHRNKYTAAQTITSNSSRPTTMAIQFQSVMVYLVYICIAAFS